ncbi:MAG: DUF1641 domain-containing protein [Anaerolineales bacterium]|nr:DUF1641 domain-containing protein [Anaerolineales bacterium]MCB9127933.1 DUF1641 domain-containing protein [Ardenticatenales bacterium]MCB9171695.1 DUF1641 domain-containing protein [Ardenticatenales bacterium]
MADLVNMTEPLALSEQVARLNEQVAALNGQIARLVSHAEADAMRRESWEDLQADAQPVVRDLYDLVVEQLAEIEREVSLEDAIRLLKRMASHTRTFESLFDQLDSANDFLADAAPITRELYDALIPQLALMEARGYLGFLRQAGYIIDRIVTAYSEEDVRQLGDNIVLILDTVKSMTQPEIMGLLGKLGSNLQEAERHADELPINTLALLRQMRDPDVRRGLAVALATLKATGRSDDA